MSSAENFGLNVEQFKVYFFKGLRLWYILVIGLILGLSFSFYNARYNVPTFNVNGRVLVKEEWKGYGADNFLPGMEVVNQRSNIKNNIGVIKSFPLMLNVIKDLPQLQFNYYDIGKVRRTELYHDKPFTITLDTLIDSGIYGSIFSLKIVLHIFEGNPFITNPSLDFSML